MSPARLTPKKKATPPAVSKPWLKLPARPDSTERQQVTLYMPDVVVPLTTRVRDLRRDMGIDDAGTITIDILDPVGDLASLELLDADEDMLLDGIDIRWGSVWWTIARLERSDDGWSIIAQDQKAADMQAHKRPMKASRNDMTRAAFVYQLVRAVKVHGGIVAYIPELETKQKIAKAELPDDTVQVGAKTVAKVASKSAAAGWGTAGSKVKIKGGKASSKQLQVLNEGLAEAARLGASRRVMMAVDMAMTQESEMGLLTTSVSGLHHGPLHQSDAWGGGKTTALAVRAFLTLDKGPGVEGWRAKYGSLHSASGNLGEMIDRIQVAGTPSAFGQWEKEAGQNVDLWIGRNGKAMSTSTSTTKPEYYTQQFAFKTSDTDENVNWWEATGQLATDVKWHRWAAANTFGYASDDELIRGNPVLFLSRTDKFVVSMPWTWDVRREAAELTVSLLLEDEWQLLPGMVVMVDDEAPISGRWIVQSISDTPRNANAPVDVTLRRRNAKAVEPASTVVQREVKETTTKVGGKSSYGGGTVVRKSSSGLVYPLSVHGKDLGGVAAHKARPFGNWQSDNAVDIGCPRGTRVLAVADGQIIRLGGSWSGGSRNPDGFNVTIQTKDNSWFYTHLRFRSPELRVGGTVKAGQFLGGSGAANGVDHLHIGSLKGDPEKLLGV